MLGIPTLWKAIEIAQAVNGRLYRARNGYIVAVNATPEKALFIQSFAINH